MFITICFLAFYGESNAQWPIMKPDADSMTHICLDYIYDMQFDKARECYVNIQYRYPEHPIGYFLDALVEWWNITLYRETEQYDNIFLMKIERVIDVCDLILAKNEADIVGLFFKGGAIGYKGRLYTLRNDYLKAATAGSKAQEILNTCLTIAEHNYDVMLGTGIYNYFTDVLRKDYPLLEPLLSFLQPGNKAIGLSQLRAAARNSVYSSVEAKVVLLQIYYQYENNIAEAMKIAKELHERYPNNPYFERYLGRCYVRMYEIDKWERLWKNVINSFARHKYGYDNYTAREALYYVGSALLYKGQYSNALKYFKKCIEASKLLDEVDSGFKIKAYIKSANIYDILNDRQTAVKLYNEILMMKDYDNSHNEARRFLAKPFGKN
jgi:hypothetical protein